MQLEPQKKKDAAGFDPLALLYPYLPFIPWIALCALLFAAQTTVKLAFSPTLYEATTLLKLSDSTKTVSSMASSSAGQAEAAPDVILQTYVEEARSDNVADRVAQILDVSSVSSLRKMDKRVLANVLASRVSVKNYRSTSLVQIQALAESPQLAADLANTWAKSFVDEDLNIVHAGAAAVHHFLEDQSAQVLEQLVQTQRQYKAYSGKTGAKINEQNIDAQILAADQRITQLKDEYSNLYSKYNPGHPLMKSNRAELEQATEDRDRLLERSGDVTLRKLDEEIKALEIAIDWIMQKEQETMVSENMSASNIQVWTPATPPYNPSFPKRRQALVKSLVEGVAVGFALTWAFLFFRRPVQREEDLCQATGAEFLGMIPDFELEERLVPPAAYPPGWMTRLGLRKAMHPLKALAHDLRRRWQLLMGWLPLKAAPGLPDEPRHQGTYFQKAFGEIRNRLLLEDAFKKPVCLAVFTPGYREGRSTANAGLALALARSGKKVLLIDANPFNPSVAALFGLEPSSGPGLTGLLDSEAPSAPKPLSTAYPRLFVLPTQAGSSFAPDWVASQAVLAQFQAWKNEFDCILLDPPPLNSFTGAQNLTEIMDGIVLMASSGRTLHSNLKNVMQLLKERRIAVLGCLLNRADIRYYSQAHYYFYSNSGLGRRVTEKTSPKPA
jgi:Mrp family chromosome partitioning ATPase/capsular polysaccharide biosynthesis protein